MRGKKIADNIYLRRSLKIGSSILITIPKQLTQKYSISKGNLFLFIDLGNLFILKKLNEEEARVFSPSLYQYICQQLYAKLSQELHQHLYKPNKIKEV